MNITFSGPLMHVPYFEILVQDGRQVANFVFHILNIWKPFRGPFSDMNEWISFILGTVMTCDRTLMHVKQNFGPIQYGRHMADFGLCQDGPFRGQISVLNNVTWTLSCMNIVYSGPLMHVASFRNFGPRWLPGGKLFFPYTYIWEPFLGPFSDMNERILFILGTVMTCD